jgi:hypothetical protein
VHEEETEEEEEVEEDEDKNIDYCKNYFVGNNMVLDCNYKVVEIN